MNPPRSSTQISIYHKGYPVTVNPPEKSCLPEVMQVDYYLEKARRESFGDCSNHN